MNNFFMYDINTMDTYIADAESTGAKEKYVTNTFVKNLLTTPIESNEEYAGYSSIKDMINTKYNPIIANKIEEAIVTSAKETNATISLKNQDSVIQYPLISEITNLEITPVASTIEIVIDMLLTNNTTVSFTVG